MGHRHAALALVALLLVVSAAGSVAQPSHGEGSNPDAAVKQAKEIATQVWQAVSPWVQRGVQWATSAGRDVFSIVFEKASFQGLRSVAAEASRIGFNFFTGRPYQAAYQVAKDVPVVGSAVKDVVGEANLRKNAAREHAEEKKEL